MYSVHISQVCVQYASYDVRLSITNFVAAGISNIFLFSVYNMNKHFFTGHMHSSK